jgi:hypothetical protein
VRVKARTVSPFSELQSPILNRSRSHLGGLSTHPPIHKGMQMEMDRIGGQPTRPKAQQRKTAGRVTVDNRLDTEGAIDKAPEAISRARLAAPKTSCAANRLRRGSDMMPGAYATGLLLLSRWKAYRYFGAISGGRALSHRVGLSALSIINVMIRR